MATATSNPWPIAPIAASDLNFAVVNYDFASFTDAEQSELPSLEGALDVSLLDFAASIADQTVLIASLFDGLDDMLTILGELDSSDDIGSTLGALANTASAADATLSDYAGQLTGSTGGGGGTGGGTTSGCQTIALGKQPEYTSGVFTHFPLSLTLQNNSQKAVTIQSTSFNPSFPNIYKLFASIDGKVLNPGDSLQFTIVVTAEGDGEVDTTFTVQTDGPDPQPCVKITMEIDPNPVTPTSGPGGPQPQIAPVTLHKV